MFCLGSRTNIKKEKKYQNVGIWKKRNPKVYSDTICWVLAIGVNTVDDYNNFFYEEENMIFLFFYACVLILLFAKDLRQLHPVQLSSVSVEKSCV